MILFLKNILAKFFKPKTEVNHIIKENGQEKCNSCGLYISSWLGGINDKGNIIRTCVPCCNKENEGIEFKYENDDPVKQVIEYNAYKDGVKVGNTLRIGYFTPAQCDAFDKITEEIYEKERNKNSHEKTF
jgi:hypothetical protein